MGIETWLDKCERLAMEARRREENARKTAEDWERRAYVERRCLRALERYEAYYRLLDALLGEIESQPEESKEDHNEIQARNDAMG